jgi:hypothetical protein
MCSGARATTLKIDSLRMPVPAHGASTARGAEGSTELFQRTRSLALDGSENTAGRLPFLGSETTRTGASERAPHLRMKSIAIAVAAERKMELAAETGTTGLSRVASAPVTEDEKRAKRIPLGVYTGEESRPGIPHGRGLLLTKTGHRFEGQWQKGHMHGQGSCQSPSGRNYTGEWCKGKMTGKGMQTFPNSVVETGIFQNGRPHGYCEKQNDDGSRYAGFFVDGLPEGEGTQTQPNGDFFKGLWSSGLPLQGEGRQTSGSRGESGLVEGSWEYIGGLNRMKWHGEGKLWFNVGKGSNKKLLWSFDGEFAEGKKHGVGTKTHWVEGWKYEGQWHRDAMTGCGTLTCPRLEGALRADVYQGSFVDGVPHGNSKYVRGDGQMQDGEFMHGEFVRGDACLKFANDAVYTGKCVGNLMHGLGTMTWPGREEREGGGRGREGGR